MAPIGQANLTGHIRLSGPKSAMDVYGVLNLADQRGSLKIQVDASNVRLPGNVRVSVDVIGATGRGAGLLGETGTGVLTLGNWIGSTFIVNQGLYPQAIEQPAHGHFVLRLALDQASA
jgi:hypothetical protein